MRKLTEWRLDFAAKMSKLHGQLYHDYCTVNAFDFPLSSAKLNNLIKMKAMKCCWTQMEVTKKSNRNQKRWKSQKRKRPRRRSQEMLLMTSSANNSFSIKSYYSYITFNHIHYASIRIYPTYVSNFTLQRDILKTRRSSPVFIYSWFAHLLRQLLAR